MFQETSKLYHCNEKEKIETVMTTKRYDILKSVNDRFWLGDGIYFWDNMGNAQYWKSERLRKNHQKEYDIACMLVCLDNKLDLTDSNVRIALEGTFEVLAEKEGNFATWGFGEKINYIMKKRQEIQEKYHVIVADGSYPNTKTYLFRQKFSKYPSLTVKTKRIYNVINKKAILTVLETEDDQMR